MTTAVDCHPTAVIHDGAELGAGVKVGPYAVVHGTAKVGDGCEIGAFAIVDDYTTLGEENVLFPHACIGSVPQDKKFSGEISYLVTGARNVFREFVTVNRGTIGGGGVTRVGAENLFMAYSHVAHDCQIGDQTIFGNAATLAGHVEVGDYAIINAFCGIQQYCRIGAHVYLAGYSGVTKDVVPFALADGNHVRVRSVNVIGLRRRGFGADTLAELKRAFRLLFRGGLNTSQALAAIDEEGFESPEIGQLVAFIQASRVGIAK